MATKKQVTIIARYTNKQTGVVSYLVRASNGIDTYCTTFIDGIASGCSCPSRNGKCYHRTQLAQKEQERQETAQKFAAKSMPAWAMNLVQTGKIIAPAKTEKTETIVEAPAKVEAPVVPQYTNMFKKPWTKIAKQREQSENYREIKAQSRSIRENRDMGERGNLNTGRAFSLMR